MGGHSIMTLAADCAKRKALRAKRQTAEPETYTRNGVTRQRAPKGAPLAKLKPFSRWQRLEEAKARAAWEYRMTKIVTK